MRSPMLATVPLLTLIFCGPAPVSQEEQLVPFPNGGFERGDQQWRIPKGGMGGLSTEQAASGKYSLKIVDEDGNKGGSNVTSAPIPVRPLEAYELSGKAFPVSGSGLGIYPRLVKADGGLAVRRDAFHLSAPSRPAGQWLPFRKLIYTTPDTAFLEVWIHSYSHAKVVAYLDDFARKALGRKTMQPPWEPSYKLRAEDKDKLTPADVVGPDGIVYPDFTYAGVPGGIPEVPVKARLAEYGVRPGDEDISQALAKAAEEVARQGGGAIEIGPGTFTLNRPVQIIRDGVVIRGVGPGKTKIIFRYAVPDGGIAFYQPQDGATIYPATPIEAHADPSGLVGLEISLDGKRLSRRERQAHWGNTFQITTTGSRVLNAVGPGDHRLTAVAEYRNGRRAEDTITVTARRPRQGEQDPDAERAAHRPRGIAAIMFCGIGWAGPNIKLARDGNRGDLELELESTEGLAPGDAIVLEGPATERWKKLTRNACKWGTYRRYEFRIEAVEGNRIRLNQPLRIQFPVIDGSFVRKVVPIRRCGVEDLYIEQTQNLWISSVVFSNAWECWARNVTVRKCGRFPVYAWGAKWCEIRDSVFDDAWFKGGGGTAYAGWEHSCDCLTDGLTTHKLRHAPCYQWAASGNVIRNSTFHESDGQWHSGWTNENLFENCVIDAKQGNGSYGYGMWASPPEDAAHGPNGPRNVVYNCDVRSPKSGLWMGGMNENWLILYNRYDVGSGPGIYAKTASFDHIIRGNVFILRDEKQPMLVLQTPDCVGVEATDNRVYGGNSKSPTTGPARPAVERGNAFHPFSPDAPRPQPPVPSIYEWQRENVKHDW